MILDKEVEVNITGNIIKYYKELGYEPKCNTKMLVDIKHLPTNSGVKINVSCDICGCFRIVKYQNYNNQFNKGGYYCCVDCGRNKIKETCISKYGFDNPMKSYIIKNKKESTNIEKYGVVSYSKTIEYKDKFKNTCMNRYGFDNPMKSSTIKNKLIDTLNFKYGVSNIMFLESTKDKIKETCIFRYGVSNISKLNLPKITSKFFNNIMYQSSYELDFLEYCLLNNIDVERGKSFRYMFEDKEHTYHSDFFLPEYNLICEIKSNYTYNCDLYRNILKSQSVLGYNFLFIIDKEYSEFNLLIK